MSESGIFTLPDLGEGLTEAEIVAWHVGVGDRVVAGQPLVSVETDKAVVEIPAPESGVIAELHGAVGDRLPVGAPLVTFGTAGADAGAVVGRLADATSPAPHPATERATAVGTTPAIAAASTAGTQAGEAAQRTAPTGAPVAAPAVRRLARELGVDLTRVSGSGPEGAILSRDVQAAVGSPGIQGAAAQDVPLRGPRRAMAERMAAAHARVVPATVTGEADIDGWTHGTRPLPRLVRAIIAAARAEPRLNAAFDDTRWILRPNAQVHLGIAMETEEGLFVPVLRDAGKRSAADLAAEVDALQAAVRGRTITPERLRGQTITLSNFGAVAGIHAAMVVVPPQVAIVGAGRAAPRVVAGASGPVVHRVLPLSLSIDHRVVTGVEACRFLAALIADLEQSQ
jgi:pyruvate dehydrogenase E2 component (dihydrolipoamide acetyltransferase)